MAAKKLANPFSRLQRWYYYKSYFPQIGLKADDVKYDEGAPEVKEALRRLPKNLFYEREFRISRAIQLNLQKDILPEEEWTKYETDEPYLGPYVDDVKDEMEEKAWWKRHT